MYSPPGEYVTDFCIIKRADLYHLFHIRGERWTWPFGYKELDLGHATSPDLFEWTAHEPVLPSGQPSAWDECGNWAPDIIELDGTYYCYYTGSDSNNNQAIGLATSTDLFAWRKHANNPVVSPGDWSDCQVGHDVAGRDAMVFYDGVRTRYLLYYTATMADGRACLALAQSSNLIDWHDLGPTYIEEDRSYNRLESAYLVEQGGRYYLFYSAKGGPKSKGFSPDEFAHFDIVYLVSDDPTGGWVKPPNHELLLGTTCASEHPTLDGVTYMLYIIQEEIDGIWGASSLSDPKRIEWLADGTVQIREHLPVNTQHQVLFDQLSMSFAGWVQHGGEWLVERDEVTVSSPAADSFLMNTLWGNDLAIEAKIWVESTGAASLLVRSNPSALAGYRIGLDFVHRTIGLFVRFPTRPDQLLQQRSIDLKTGQWCKLKVVVQGAFFDVYVDDALVLVRHHRLYEAGCFGLHTREDVRFRSIHAYHPPPLKRADPEWQQRCLPRNWFPNR